MYQAILIVHSYVRWLVLLTTVWALARAVVGLGAERLWTPADEFAGRVFVAVLDLQLLVGLLLYIGISPVTQAAFGDMGAAMHQPLLRFFAVEHIFGMVVAVTLAHIGRAKSRKGMDPTRRHRTAAIYFSLALLAMLVTIPWPFLPYGRPLFRW
jgi:hypothetical protein